MYDIKNLTISSTNPCLIIYLLDQSGSMSDTFGNATHSKAIELASAINDVISEIGQRCTGNSGVVKNRFELAIIGYGKDGDTVQSAWEGQLENKWVVSIKDVFDYPLGEADGIPIWIKPYASGSTPMTRAFENATRLCKDWIGCLNHIDCHPPIIINITDGEATDTGNDFRALQNQVNELKKLTTNYGAVNVLNIHISSRNGDRLLFPEDIANTKDRFANLLFNMSTSLNENMIRIAKNNGYTIQDDAKGYIFNGNATDLINFLNVGTPK